MISLKVARFNLANPVWSTATAYAGQTVTLSADAAYISSTQWLEFRIMLGTDIFDVVTSKPGKTSATWKAPNLKTAAGAGNGLSNPLSMTAVLREDPAAANGFMGIMASVGCPTQLTLNGYEVEFTSADECFVPKQEELNTAYTVYNPGNAPLKGRFEIWAERYPGKKAAPAYTETLDPATGAATWVSWDGKANSGELSGSYLTPEFSPYRVRLVIGTESGDVSDAYEKGLGFVAAAEIPFEVRINYVNIRILKDVKEAAKKKQYKLEEALGIEPRDDDGSYADTARLPNGTYTTAKQNGTNAPTADETGRIRIPVAIFMPMGSDLGQGGDDVGDDYGAGKWAVDHAYYTRPELPIEFEPHLRSRDNTINDDPDQKGLFEPDAVGPLLLEPFAEDFYEDAMFGGGVRGAYWKNAALKVKRGAPDTPYNDGTDPEYAYWQARFEVPAIAAGDLFLDFDVTNFDLTYKFTYGSEELTVFVNGAPLTRSDAADDTELIDEKFDYRELDPGGGDGKDIHIRADLLEEDDIIWVVRVPDPSPGGTSDVEDWNLYPPGKNCHAHYGGERGKEAEADRVGFFRQKFSKNPTNKKKQPIIGKMSGSEFPYNKNIILRTAPDVDVDKQERVEISAITSGKLKGKAGVIFTPSYIAGDSYKLHALVEEECYNRSFGYVQRNPRVDEHTGLLEVWRVASIAKSYRLPDVGTNDLDPAVGSLAEFGLGAGGPGGGYPVGTTPRLYKGDGLNMSFTAANGIGTMMERAFCEWVVPEPKGGASSDPLGVHLNIDLKKYRKTVNKFMKPHVGRFEMKTNADIRNWLAMWDPYREQLPPGVPAALINLISNTIAGLPAGTAGADVGNAVQQAIVLQGVNPDVALDQGVTPIPIFGGGNSTAYSSWVEGIWDDMAHAVLDEILGRDAEPSAMKVLRWPYLHENRLWIGYDDGTDTAEFETSRTNGECIGSGQSYFLNAVVTETFSHEMGHSLFLAHFVAGDFNWKHHNVSSPDCLMSYAHSKGRILKVGGAVGPDGGTKEDGWPDNPGGNRCIDFPKLNSLLPPIPRSTPCEKCSLKVRGWKDELLPFAWEHPDLY